MMQRFAIVTSLILLACPVTAQDPTAWDPVHFEAGSSEIAEGFSGLTRLARVLQDPTLRVLLESHLDRTEAKSGSDKLSQARGESVKAYLVKLGVKPEQIEVASKAADDPRASNSTREGRFQNRRVEIQVRDNEGRVVAHGDADETAKLANRLDQIGRGNDDILRRLDKLDDLAASNNRFHDELSQVRNELNRMKDQLNGMPKPLTAHQTTEIVRSTVQGARDPWWTGGQSGREFLLGTSAEKRRYGLYSYLLFPRQPADGDAELKRKYIAALDAYQADIPTIEALNNQPKPPPLKRINITYLPLTALPDSITSEKLLRLTNQALGATLLEKIKDRHPSILSGEGPFIVSYIKPLTGEDHVGEHLYMDMTGIPPNVVELYMRAFLTQASRRDFWKRDRKQWVLDCYAFIEASGAEFSNVAAQFKDKTFLSTVFNWFGR